MENEFRGQAFQTKLNRDPTLLACYPHPKFPTLSITGTWCALSCKHCNRYYLRSMTPCVTPEAFYRECLKRFKNGARGALISGGYNSEGWVPLEGFLDAIERVKRETGLFLNAHLGLAPDWLVRELGRVGLDMVSFDLIGSDETVRLILGIQKKVKDYERVLRVLERSIPRVVPHICIGLHEGEIKGERKALEMAAKANISGLVFLVLIPTSGTAFQNVSPPEPAEVGKIIAEARLKFPETPLALGCMRPRTNNRAEFEIQAIKSGIDRMELPSSSAIEASRKLGLHVKKLEACCGIPTEVARRWAFG